jgi:CheY-like chemotaxis protein
MSDESNLVMVVEDEEVLLKAITRKLEISGKKVISCVSGKQALDYLANIGEMPDLIWLDYYLKDMNGLDFMFELKKNDSWSRIPVLVVSNSASEEKVTRMLALGAKKYMLKAESKLDDLVNEVNGMILNKGGS